MKKNIFYCIITSISILSCFQQKKLSTNNKPEDKLVNSGFHKLDSFFYKNYDSVKFYKDVDLTDLKGKKELTIDNLLYPFVAFKYKKNVIELVSFWNKEEIRKWTIKNNNRFWYTEFEYQEKRPFQKEYYTILFTKKNGFVSIYHDTARFNPHSNYVKPRLIIFDKILTSNIEQESKSYRYYQENGSSILLKDIIDFNKVKLDNCYLEYAETINKFEGNKLYMTRDYLFDLREKKDIRNSKKRFLRTNDFSYPSFFYYIMHNQSLYYTNLP